jgi:hypothetical protein
LPVSPDSGILSLVGIQDDVVSSANWIASALTSSGYTADFSAESLAQIDRFFDEQSRRGTPVKRGLLSEGLGQRIFGIGSYVGEVIRRGVGGAWVGDDSDPEAEINVCLILDDGSTIWPVQRVMKRYKNGRDDSLVAYGAALGLGARPTGDA